MQRTDAPSPAIAEPAQVLTRSPLAGDETKRPPIKPYKDVRVFMPGVHRDRVVELLCDRYGLGYGQACRALGDAAPVVRWNCDLSTYLHEIMRVHGKTELARIRVDTDCTVGRRSKDGWYTIRLHDEEAGLYLRVHHRAEDRTGVDEDLELAFGLAFQIVSITGTVERVADAYWLTGVVPDA